MAISRSSRYSAHGAWRWLSWLLMLALAACGAADQGAAAPAPQDSTETHIPIGGAEPLGTPVTRAIQSATPAATTITAAMTAWQTYHSVQEGYTVEYPATWTVSEQSGATGVATTFTASDGHAAIVVSVRPTDPTQQELLDLPNTRCQPVHGNRGIATRCLDTITRTTATTFVGQDRTYNITTSGKDMDETVYEHVLDSFTPDSPAARDQSQAAGRPQDDLVSLLLQSGDLPDSITGARAKDAVPANFDDTPPATRIISLQLMREGRGAGSVAVLLYDSTADLAQAYQRMTTSVLSPFTGADTTTSSTPDIGEQAIAARLTLASSTYGPSHVAVITFARCRALIDVRLNESAGLTMDQAITYAKHLDQRVAKLTCP
jgi:hypothetical protein